MAVSHLFAALDRLLGCALGSRAGREVWKGPGGGRRGAGRWSRECGESGREGHGDRAVGVIPLGRGQVGRGVGCAQGAVLGQHLVQLSVGEAEQLVEPGENQGDERGLHGDLLRQPWRRAPGRGGRSRERSGAGRARRPGSGLRGGAAACAPRPKLRHRP